ncbi:hypothetical protein CP971_33145 [Streptomyces viridifaciens]|nr:hypothetical protein CP971_33145 [Streptomyces viridifaciens]
MATGGLHELLTTGIQTCPASAAILYGLTRRLRRIRGPELAPPPPRRDHQGVGPIRPRAARTIGRKPAAAAATTEAHVAAAALSKTATGPTPWPCKKSPAQNRGRCARAALTAGPVGANSFGYTSVIGLPDLGPAAAAEYGWTCIAS